jgi:L,D-peptidoglycan transpeptidase YkuD (ErfK/YbiS/YcfS/YnhG family)
MTPVSDPSWVACSPELGGVQVAVGARQRSVTVVNGNGGSWATVSFWLRTETPCGFANVFTESGGRIGYDGLTDGAPRAQGDGTTPTGTYTMTEAFGIGASPGTALPYRRVAVGDFWVEDNNSAFYNTYRNESQGGFDTTLPLCDPDGSERLLDFPGHYDYVIVVDFNRAPDVRKPYRGAGIFLHVRGNGATAGCVAVSSSEMVTMLRAIRPGDTVTIAP